MTLIAEMPDKLETSPLLHNPETEELLIDEFTGSEDSSFYR
jgi:hypothetical protein